MQEASAIKGVSPLCEVSTSSNRGGRGNRSRGGALSVILPCVLVTGSSSHTFFLGRPVDRTGVGGRIGDNGGWASQRAS